MTIEEEIKQKKFKSETVKATINILFTSSHINVQQTQILKPFDISWQQFNILRILRGRKGEPTPLKMLSARMVDRSSNTSRLVEKLKNKGLLERLTNDHDRRKVDIFITEKGLRLVEEATHEMDEALENNICHLSEEELIQLNNLLDRFRG